MPLLHESDIIVLLLPLTGDTRGLVNKTRFAAMKKGAALINFARGPILEAGAMFEALETGQLSHAVLDVFNIEPLPESCPCWLHKHVTVLPHISAVTKPASAAKIVAENIAIWRRKGKLPQTVDLQRGY